jgi:uncharacterized membrane protein YphA (DoxX/SURF4 family)
LARQHDHPDEMFWGLIYAVREYELPLILGLASLVVAVTGGGPFSLDRLIFCGAKDHASAS